VDAEGLGVGVMGVKLRLFLLPDNSGASSSEYADPALERPPDRARCRLEAEPERWRGGGMERERRKGFDIVNAGGGDKACKDKLRRCVPNKRAVDVMRR